MPMSAKTPPNSTPTADSNTIVILVVDDEPDNFDVIEVILNNQPYQLHYASSGQEALDVIDMYQPDLILLDVMMPEMDGIEVCLKIKANPKIKHTPIIMVTALTEKDDLAKCLDAGADDFISKPVNQIELRARVNSMLRLQEQYKNIQMLSILQENTILVLTKNLEELSKNLTTTLPHEINTPLNGVYGVLDLLINKKQELSEEINDLLILAFESVKRLRKLTQRFLIYSQLEIKNSKINTKQSVDLEIQDITTKSLIEDIISYQANKNERINDLLIDFNDFQAPAIKSKDFQHLIMELIDNAFKFSEVGTQVTVISKIVNNQFNLTITNQGRIMTTEQIATIGPFKQFERQYYEQQGVGLGLKIASLILQIYQGKLSIVSNHELGTKVEIQLPLINN